MTAATPTPTPIAYAIPIYRGHLRISDEHVCPECVATHRAECADLLAGDTCAALADAAPVMEFPRNRAELSPYHCTICERVLA